jgi:hypothetical protein
MKTGDELYPDSPDDEDSNQPDANSGD